MGVMFASVISSPHDITVDLVLLGLLRCHTNFWALCVVEVEVTKVVQLIKN